MARVIADQVGVVNRRKEGPDDARDGRRGDHVDLHAGVTPDRQALEAGDEDDYPSAIALCSEALARDPSLSGALINRGNQIALEGKDDAVEVARSALTRLYQQVKNGDDIDAACGQLVGQVVDRTRSSERYRAAQNDNGAM